MKNLLMLRGLALGVAIALAGCGGGGAGGGSSVPSGGSGGTLQQSILVGAPTWSDVALEMYASDATPPTTTVSVARATQAIAGLPCHPTLFDQTHNVVTLIDTHMEIVLEHVNQLVAENPTLTTGSSVTFKDVTNGLGRQFTLTKNADGSYSYVLAMAAHGSSSFVTVYSGTLVITSSGGVTTRTSNMTFDYNAYGSVNPSITARGQIALNGVGVHDTSKPGPGLKKTLNLTLTNFLPQGGDVHGPRNATYTHISEPSIGGDLVYTDASVDVCPSNPTFAVGNEMTDTRWYVTESGTHGRSDANATGGVLTAGQQFVGTDCYNGADDSTDYWAMKLEDGSGNTVAGGSTPNHTAICDPVFGTLPSLANNSTDYNFSAPVSFPGEW